MPNILKIYGAPGTGKTTFMLAKLEEELRLGTALDRIAFVTHTIDARDEARTRAQKIIPSAEDKQFKWFRTIHGICFTALDLNKEAVMQNEDYMEFGEKCGIPFSTNWTADIGDDGLPDGWIHSPGNSIMAIRQLASARCLSEFSEEIMAEWPPEATPNLVREVLNEYDAWKIQKRKFDFVDMLEMYLHHNNDPIDIDVLFIDEAQDLSKKQWQVVNKFMLKAKRVYIAGDDDQSIYGFIGADPLGFLHYPSDESIVLGKTYRLKSNIWKFSQKIITQVRERKEKQIEVRGSGGVVEFTSNPFWEDELDANVNTMIIARHNNMLTRLARKLDQRGIPYLRRGKATTHSKAASATIAYYRAVKRREALNGREAAKIMRLFGLDGKELDNIGRIDSERLFTPKELEDKGVYFGPNWIEKIKATAYERKQIDSIRSALNDPNIGADLLLKKPNIDLQTYHSCKGREADHVILLTKCYDAAWEAALRDPDTEKRIAYVGATRAKEKLTIVQQGGTQYMRPLIDG